MLDVMFVLVSIVFFVAAAAYVRGCQRLMPRQTPRNTRNTRMGKDASS